MSREIVEYPLPSVPEHIIQVPLGSTPLTVLSQYAQPYLWVETDTSAMWEETWTVRMIKAGQRFDADDAGDYLGALVTWRDSVVHVYVKRPDDGLADE